MVFASAKVDSIPIITLFFISNDSEETMVVFTQEEFK